MSGLFYSLNRPKITNSKLAVAQILIMSSSCRENESDAVSSFLDDVIFELVEESILDPKLSLLLMSCEM